MQYDLLLKGGLVFDGTGAPPTCLDIGIADGRIARLAPVIDGPAREVRDIARSGQSTWSTKPASTMARYSSRMATARS